MIMTVEEVRTQVGCQQMYDDEIKSKLGAIEEIIRKYTNNNFQNKYIRFCSASVNGNQLDITSDFLRVNDTIQITQSMVNDGLYQIIAVLDDCIEVDGELFDVPFNRVTKVEYPEAVKQCAIALFKWELEFGSKIGIKSESETLSRHSETVTYEDSATLFMGYPIGILNGLRLYKKARC